MMMSALKLGDLNCGSKIDITAGWVGCSCCSVPGWVQQNIQPTFAKYSAGLDSLTVFKAITASLMKYSITLSLSLHTACRTKKNILMINN